MPQHLTFGLIGERLSHSFSKSIHEALTGREYSLVEIPREGLADFLTKRQFKAINVTIPYKEAVIPYLDSISPEALAVGAVNVIVYDGGLLKGYNTDIDGFSYMAQGLGVDFKGKNVLILGTGGAAKTASYVASQNGASMVRFASRHKSGDNVILYEDTDKFADIQIVVNATPVGMYPDIFKAPVDLKHFPSIEAIMDCIYNPLRSCLVLDAQARGAKACGGLVMLVEQARRAIELFHGTSLSQSVTDSYAQRLFRERSNIVLFGLPASGKTTLGRLLSEKLSREFIDTDLLIEQSAGMSIPEIFRTEGEKGFRQRERKCIETLALQGGKVISVGGGAMMDDANVRSLRLNGTLVLVERDIELCLVDSTSRPLSSSRADLKRLYDLRHPRYACIADSILSNNSTPQQAVEGFDSPIL